MELVPVSCTVRPSRAETPPPSLKRTKLEDTTPAVPTAAYYSALGMAPTLPNYMVDPFHYFYGAWVPPPTAMYLNNPHHLYRNDRLDTSQIISVAIPSVASFFSPVALLTSICLSCLVSQQYDQEGETAEANGPAKSHIAHPVRTVWQEFST